MRHSQTVSVTSRPVVNFFYNRLFRALDFGARDSPINLTETDFQQGGTMLRKALVVCLLAVAGQANAGLITLTATSKTPFSISNFSVIFNDSSDGLLQIGEVVAGGFSGVSFLGFGSSTNLVSVADISGFASGTVGPNWVFSVTGFGNLLAPSDRWTYSKSPDTTTSVPEPGTLDLLGAGLLALGWLRFRRRIA